MTKLKLALASRVLAGTSVLLACTQVWAQSTATSIEEGSLEEVVVSGETISDSVGAGAAVLVSVPEW